jgi:phospholipase/carboxylesterase
VSAQGLTVRAVGKTAPGGLTVILLHGFGAPGDDLVDLARYLEAPPGTRFLFPEAPLELSGLYGGARAWWMIDLEQLDRALPLDRAQEIPPGLAPARRLVTGLLERVIAEGAGPIVLGGFSQGAMLSLDTALHLDERAAAHLAGLVLMSGTPINGAAWAPRLGNPGPVTKLPILLSHGRADPLLAFSAAQRLRDQLRAAGAAVDWVEFDGGHEIPPAVLTGASRVLHAAAERSAPETSP